MSTRERILVIRLLEKAAKHPNYAKALGIEGETVKYSLDQAVYSDIAGSSRKK